MNLHPRVLSATSSRRRWPTSNTLISGSHGPAVKDQGSLRRAFLYTGCMVCRERQEAGSDDVIVDALAWCSSIVGRRPGMSWLHGCAPPGCPQLAWSLKALRCLQSAFGVRLLCSARTHPNPDLISRSIRGRGWGVHQLRGPAKGSGQLRGQVLNCESLLTAKGSG